MGQPVLVIMGRCCVEREKISSASSELVTVLHSSAGGGGDPPQVNHWAALPCWPDQSGRGWGVGGAWLCWTGGYSVYVVLNTAEMSTVSLASPWFKWKLYSVILLSSFVDDLLQLYMHSKYIAMHSTGNGTPVVPCTMREPTPAQSHKHTRDVSRREITAVFSASVKNLLFHKDYKWTISNILSFHPWSSRHFKESTTRNLSFTKSGNFCPITNKVK